ncbi:MAG TPA: hypothetical protein VFS21_36040 [Roseiflexaceae bacterium]|nr:hypothetical protein [Roseiflexaceae bacterium]
MTNYEAAFAYLREESYNGGMDYYDFLRLLAALLQSQEGPLPAEHLAELAFHLTDGQRALLQQLAESAGRLDDAAIAAGISEEQYHAQKTQQFGAANPEQMDMPFWVFMVQRGWIAYQARMQFDSAYRRWIDAYRALGERREAGEQVPDEPDLPHPGYGPPVWCFKRFGMTVARLPDGRALFIAGEHEDFYDPDFCIYNDVIAVDRDLRVTIYGYPKESFPPTDFHTATLVGDTEVYIIGNLGYLDERQAGATPVYRLDTETMQITAVPTSGNNPGWISRHQATYNPKRNTIRLSGGQIWTKRGSLRENKRVYTLDLASMIWSRKDAG